MKNIDPLQPHPLALTKSCSNSTGGAFRDDDDDLFSSGSQTKVSSSKAPKPNSAKATPHDDNDDDDFFSSGSQKVPSKTTKPKAAPSDNDGGSHTASKATKTLSNDDDLFSSGSSSKAPVKSAKRTPKAASPEVEGIDDPLGGGTSAKATPSSKTTPTKTTAMEDKKAGKKSAPAPLFGISPETSGSSSTKPKPAAGHVTKSEKPAPVASKPVKKNAGLFEDSEGSEGEEDLFGPPKPKLKPSGSDTAPQEEPSSTVASSRRKPVGGVAMFGGAGPIGEKASEKTLNIAKKQEELFSEWVW